MTIRWTNGLAMGATLFMIAGCETVSEQMVRTQTTPPRLDESWQAKEDMELKLGGQKAQNVVSSMRSLREVLEGYGGTYRGGTVRDLIDQNRDSNYLGLDVPALSGLGGMFGHAFLDVADDARIRNPRERNYGKFMRNRLQEVSVSGQLVAYEFVEGSTPGRGNGSIEAITYIERRVQPVGQGTPQTRTEAYWWKISVINQGFEVHEHSNDPDDPFPGTLPFDQETKDRIENRGFEFKLWATGGDIVVDEILVDHNYDPNNPNFVALNPNNPNYADLFQSDPASCIDMMFVDYPPETLPDGAEPPFYCLGRCQHPYIINTM